MKPVKVLALAALAALTAMAFVGAGSAMGETTALCEFDTIPLENGEVCPEGHRVTHIHEETLDIEPVEFLNAILNVECDVLFLGQTITPLRSPLLITGNFTYANCNENCTVTEENGPAIYELLKSGHEYADVLLDFLILVSCPNAIHCRYKAEGLPGEAEGPLLSIEENGEIEFFEVVIPKESGFFCPFVTKLDLVTTPLDPTYIAK